MNERSSHHDTFVIDRVYPAPVARVFNAWADPAAKARWFVGPVDRWRILVREHDFRVGGHELVRGGVEGGTTSTFESRIYDVIPNERIVFTYEMHLDDRKISVSLATIEFKPEGSGTRMRVTEQGVFLDGYDDAGSRERGTRQLLDQIEASLRDAPTKG